MLGMFFFREGFTLLPLGIYTKGFTLLPFKNGVEIAAVEGERPVSMVTPSSKFRNDPAVILEPAGASQRRAETLEASRTRF